MHDRAIFQTYEFASQFDFIVVGNSDGVTRDIDVTGYSHPSWLTLERLALIDFPDRGKSGFPRSEQDNSQVWVRFQQENPARAAGEGAGSQRYR